MSKFRGYPRKVFTLLLAVLIFNLFISPVRSISACSASVSPANLTVSSSTSLTFSVTNQDEASGSVIWVKFVAPSGDFSITGGSASGWNTTVSSSEIVFAEGNLVADSSQSFTLNITTGSSEVGASSWTVQVSDSTGGGNPVDCSGSTSVAITSLTLSGIVVSDISPSYAKISWTTSKNTTGTVSYGTSNSYGSTKDASTSQSSHSIEISSLTANTTYHYNISVTDGTSTVTSGDNTFTTALSGSTTTTTTTGTTTTVTKTETKLVKDSTSPSVRVSTDFKKAFDRSPEISGTATDDSGVSRVEYSIDNGKNWLPVETLGKQFSKSTSFVFVPSIIDDGDYQLKVRSYDTTGNVGTSTTYKLIIDRLPPMVGSSIISIGPQVLEPTQDGILFSLIGLDQKITLSSVGGANEIDLYASNQKFSLTKNPESGLWSGVLNFEKPGIYKLKVKSKDGAGNTTERQLNTVVALENGKIGSTKSSDVILYYFEPSMRKFVVWDGRPYGQQNPQKTDESGYYRLFVPAGKYYLEIKSSGYKVLKSEIFNLKHSTPINSSFELEKRIGFGLGKFFVGIPGFLSRQAAIDLKYPAIGEADKSKTAMLNKEFPQFSLQMENKPFTNLDLRGKATIVSFLNSWSPYTFEQIAQINKVSSQKGMNFLIVFPQESNSSVSIFRKRGQYTLPIMADPDGSLVRPLNLQLLPTHLFVDRKGMVQDYKAGVMTGEEMVDILVN